MAEIIDIRSDTVTKPTQQMRLAMAAAEVGDDGRWGPDGKGEDPTVRELEALAASMVGKEDAVYMPSGTMANLCALMSHCARGAEAAIGRTAHIYRNEKTPFDSDIYALQPLEIPDPAGIPDYSTLQGYLSTKKPAVFCMENTHNYAGGTVMKPETMRMLSDLAHAHGVPVHLDGARIFNAAVALGIDARLIAEPVDSLMFCLSKGLGAPIGSIVAGSAAFVARARDRRKLIGGQMRQVGVIAAAGIVALRTGVAGLAEDHEKARRLAERLAEIGGLDVDPSAVPTNMVKVDVSATGLTAKEFQAEMRKRDVLVHTPSPTEMRLVTHKDVTLEQVLRAADAIGNFALERRRGR